MDEIFSFPGFVHGSKKCSYQVTSIIGGKINAVSITEDCSESERVISITKNRKSESGLNWIIPEGQSTVSASNIDHEFGHPVMPAKCARKRTYVPYKYTPVSDVEV